MRKKARWLNCSRCKVCGLRAMMFTKKDEWEIPRKEKEFICNDCFRPKLQKKLLFNI